MASGALGKCVWTVTLAKGFLKVLQHKRAEEKFTTASFLKDKLHALEIKEVKEIKEKKNFCVKQVEWPPQLGHLDAGSTSGRSKGQCDRKARGHRQEAACVE